MFNKLARNGLMTLVLLAIIVPQVAFAAWRNPFTWKIFSNFLTTSKIQTINTPNATTSSGLALAPASTTTETVLCNGQYWNKCPAGQLLVCPTDAKIDAYCSVPKTPKTSQAPPTSKTAPTPKAPQAIPTVTTTAPTAANETRQQNSTEVVVKRTANEENFNSVGLSVLQSEINSFRDITDWIKSAQPLFDTRLTQLNRLVHINQALQTSTDVPTNIKLSQLFIDGYNSDINQTTKYKTALSNIANIIATSYVTPLQDSYNRHIGSFVSRDDFLKFMEVIKTYDASWQTVKDSASKVVNDFNTYASSKDTDYEAALAFLASKIGQSESSIKSQYVPPITYIPPVSFPSPQTTRCTLSGDGGVGLQAYMTCSTY